jgi:hypothetical protein
VNRAGPVLVIALSDPHDIATILALGKITGLAIEVVRADEQAILRALARYY